MSGGVVILRRCRGKVSGRSFERPLPNRWEETDRATSLRSDERSRSPDSVFTITGFSVQLHRNAHVANMPDEPAKKQEGADQPPDEPPTEQPGG